ncbi:unnamed protein product [Durusdinium trenchii]|uniref:V-type proton ATPase subunit a n=1 Tax=Durusdinium trenchii TaxID=1381693 RepID=A0ABP0K1N9_9DINO
MVFWFGYVANVLMWITAISRCCAPCCCEMTDVKCPCPCTCFHLLDVPFYLAVVVSVIPANFHHSVNMNEELYNEFPFLQELDFWQYMDVVLAIGVVLLLVAMPSTLWKVFILRRAKMSSAANRTASAAPAALPVVQAQVVGPAVAVEGNHPSESNNQVV